MSDGRAQVQIESPHALRQLRSAPRDVADSLRRQTAALAADPFRGTFIALAGVPKRTRAVWQARVGPVPNLYKVDLPQGWRALYFVATNERRRDVFVIEVLSHTDYDRLLGYG
jgi:hypothetical protein